MQSHADQSNELDNSKRKNKFTASIYLLRNLNFISQYANAWFLNCFVRGTNNNLSTRYIWKENGALGIRSLQSFNICKHVVLRTQNSFLTSASARLAIRRRCSRSSSCTFHRSPCSSCQPWPRIRAEFCKARLRSSSAWRTSSRMYSSWRSRRSQRCCTSTSLPCASVATQNFDLKAQLIMNRDW